MIVLKNDILEVGLDAKGAEIHKIIGLQDKINYMWKRDPSQWANSAPILFPIVGALQNNECHIHGKTYTMTQHGFARHATFNITDKTDHKVVFTLLPNEDIQQQYPFHFKLEVTYTLEDNVLACRCDVFNTDQQMMYFQIGGHPAFSCPFYENESSNDYYIEFEQFETVKQKVIDVKRKGMSRVKRPFLKQEKRFFIRQELFDNDAIVLPDLRSNFVDLKCLHHNKYIRFHMENFNHLGIWAAKHVGDLLAIEPWNGHSDYVDFHDSFEKKEGVISLAQNEMFTCTFKIEIHQ